MLLTKDTISELISKAAVNPGTYNQMRFIIDSATVITDSGSYDATIPSGEIKMNFQFSVNEDGKTTINIEINPKASLIKTGNKKNPKYILSPVLHLN